MTTRDQIIEAMARAIHSRVGYVHIDDDRMFVPVAWEELDDPEYPVIRDGYLDQASAALDAALPLIRQQMMEDAIMELAAMGDHRLDPLSFRDCAARLRALGKQP